jgi:hypothetical protein
MQAPPDGGGGSWHFYRDRATTIDRGRSPADIETVSGERGRILNKGVADVAVDA